MLYPWNYYNIVNQVCFKKKKQKNEGRKKEGKPGT